MNVIAPSYPEAEKMCIRLETSRKSDKKHYFWFVFCVLAYLLTVGFESVFWFGNFSFPVFFCFTGFVFFSFFGRSVKPLRVSKVFFLTYSPLLVRYFSQKRMRANVLSDGKGCVNFLLCILGFWGFFGLISSWLVLPEIATSSGFFLWWNLSEVSAFSGFCLCYSYNFFSCSHVYCCIAFGNLESMSLSLSYIKTLYF